MLMNILRFNCNIIISMNCHSTFKLNNETVIFILETGGTNCVSNTFFEFIHSYILFIHDHHIIMVVMKEKEGDNSVAKKREMRQNVKR